MDHSLSWSRPFTTLSRSRPLPSRGMPGCRRATRFIAEGFVRQYTYERDGQTIEGEEFTARRIGHDMARTRYEVDRTPRGKTAEREAASRDASAFELPTQSRSGGASPGMGI